MLAHTLVALCLIAAQVRTPAVGPAPTASPATQPTAPPQRWKGQIALPGMKLDFELFATPASVGKPATARMSIPLQSLKNAELRDVEIDDQHMKFTLSVAPMPESRWAHFVLDRDPDGKSAQGKMTQAGFAGDVTMRLAAADEEIGPARPQTPKPPFPYTAREVSYQNPADSAKLAGTLTLPEEAKFGKGPHAAAILITGSGAQDRDETIMGHKPFAVSADHLTRAGIAVLRVDDRGIGGSTSPKNGEETTDDFVGDVLAGVAFLRQEPEIDSKRIGLIGHSEGGLIAPMAAAKDPGIAFIVLLAGPGVPGKEVLREQLKALLKAAGVPEEGIRRQSEAQIKALDAVCAGADDATMRPLIERLTREQLGLGQLDEVPEAAAEQLKIATDGAMAQMNSPWMRRFIVLDPRESLRQVRCPVLALNGEKDTQVLAEQNMPEIRKALGEAGNKNLTAESLPGLNHLFQTCRTGGFTEYLMIEETIAPAVLDKMAQWVRQTTKTDK